MKTKPAGQGIAYSYIRFSSSEQAKGDSLRRQTEAADQWCKARGITLDKSTTLHDLGKSAFTGKHRTNPDRHALAAFLKLVEGGKVPHGSSLLIENLDRLSREDEVPACHLLTSILMAGVQVVQLSPYEMVLTEKSNGWELMRAVMELSRGHGESAIKSERVCKAWANKRRAAREAGKVVTHRLPGWIEERGSKLHLLHEPVAALKQVYALAASGYGHVSIVQRMTSDCVPPFGESGRWTRAYVSKLLRDRRVLGEYQPRKTDRSSDGEAIDGYFPAAISEAEFYAARAGAAQRRSKRGRIGRFLNIFSGLVYDARSGEPYWHGMLNSGRTSSRAGVPYYVLMSRAVREGRGPAYTFPFQTFEMALLGELKEIDPREVLGRDESKDETMVLTGERDRVKAKIAELEAELLNGEVAALAKVLRHQESRLQEIEDQLAVAKQNAASPLDANWTECQGIIEALASAPDPADAKLRLRSALRRIIERIWVLVVPHGRDRLAVLQAYFGGGARRTYLIFHRAAKANGSARQPGRMWVQSWKASPGEDIGFELEPDLRDKEQAAKLAAGIADWPESEWQLYAAAAEPIS